MKCLSQKTKIKAECLHKRKGDERPCYSIQIHESWRQRKVKGRYISCGEGTDPHWTLRSRGSTLVLNGFSLNDICSEIFPGHPPNSFTQRSSSILYPYTLSISFKTLRTLPFRPLSQWSRVQPRGRPQEGICNGVQNSRCPGNIRKYIYGVLTPTSLRQRGWDTWNRAIQRCFG